MGSCGENNEKRVLGREKDGYEGPHYFINIIELTHKKGCSKITPQEGRPRARAFWLPSLLSASFPVWHMHIDHV